MRYSVASRFRGTLLGAAIGQMLGKSPNVTESNYGVSAVLGAESLIRLGRFDVESWRNTLGDTTNCSTKAIITTLPVALFYHENEIKLRQNLQAAGWQHDQTSRDGALAVGYVLSQCLREKLNVASLIPQTVAFIGAETALAQCLLQVQTLLEQQAGLERVATEVGGDPRSTTATALAFYYFISTLEDLHLSVKRAARSSYQPELTSVITGALSGAYNSISGVSAGWRMKLFRHDAKLLKAWGMTEAEILKLSDSLVAVWSGAYEQKLHSTELTRLTAIAAPQVIRLL